MKILLIDDEELVLKSLGKVLKRQGYDVVMVNNGGEALTKVQEEEFALIITDIRMPQLNGIDTLRGIREVLKENGKKAIPEICITGYSDTETNRRAEELGIAEYLYKPFDTRDLLSCIQRAIQRQP